MKLFDKIGNGCWYFSLVILMFVTCIAVTIPVSANAEEGIHTEEFNATVKQEEEVYQDAGIDEVETEISALEAKYAQEQNQSVSPTARTLGAQSVQSYNNPQEYYTNEDLAKLEALNNVRADKIMELGVAGGAKEDNEMESSQPVMSMQRAAKWSYYGWNGAGDIFIHTYTPFPMGDFGHAGLGGDTPSTTIEAKGEGKVVKWYSDQFFTYKPSTGLLTAVHDNGAWAWYRVYSASLQQYQDAKNYAHNKILGAPYPKDIHWTFYNPNMSSWEYHCAEVVHFAWLRGAGKLVSNSKDNKAVGPYGLGPQNKYGATYRYRGDLSSKGSNN
ncbi:hypothetical protein [Culicoidibacter larvae]|uniref:Uncharacterized protein n=1 Tax=Culicoidibacter larvae TaxID=2579976 RepID=A0A5R8Q6Y0_9FIRM|nr:hypothetical protein [Culicoidibacter larvae]TLG71180.1 hypothetical protein FEZ08_11540 [Culicoidibacter larvae]